MAPEEDALDLAEEPTDEDVAVHRRLGLTDDEATKINQRLGRDPLPAELAMFSVMWSEHCSYKSSRTHLSRFPSEADWVVVGPGENAGVVDLGDDWLAAIRIESHNHPSFVEPYQGAATGVGGILRDVFTMGARPVALWDQIRFGTLDHPKNRFLFDGVVSGISGYGNAVGVPTVGGETAFDKSYAGNPLVNVMCLGVLRRENLVLGRAGPPGTLAVLVGAATGRDGIGGASVLASAPLGEDSGAKRPAVQVGDPFEEKKLIEACLELYDRDLVLGVQDLGAAGLTCAFSEPAARSGVGMRVDLDAVHTREAGMTAPELLMSESQERMMVFVDPEKLEDVLEVANRWETTASVVGVVEAGDTISIRHGDEVVAEVPATALTDEAPIYERPLGEPPWLEDLWSNTLEFMATPDVGEALQALLDDPSIASARWAYEQYDHMLFGDTLVKPGHDSSLLRIHGTSKALAVTSDGNGRLCLLDPRRGAARLVYEAALNIATVGARTLAVVDNLNFGSPEKPEVMWQFRETVEGISEACETLGIPVIGGNVSFYNESGGRDIHPTPVIGLLGLTDPVPERLPTLERAGEGMEIWFIGYPDVVNLAGSAVEQTMFGHTGGRPVAPDSVLARNVIELTRRLAVEGSVVVLHDVSDGGAAVAVSEIAIASDVGMEVQYRDWRHLFCEDPHRLVAVVEPEQVTNLVRHAEELGVPAERIGGVGGRSITLEGPMGVRNELGVDDARILYEGAISRRMDAPLL
ncbi:MAG: phosphoribosylformylglycinamidine synthase subunit PurL [Acidimicrobiia bacterium]|nr:phosphoribosylformylglycinamidine synthase subunit PurL [Acidimicrobiia bacterium]